MQFGGGLTVETDGSQFSELKYITVVSLPSINDRFLMCPPRATSAEYEGALVIGERLVADMIDAAKTVLAALGFNPSAQDLTCSSAVVSPLRLMARNSRS